MTRVFAFAVLSLVASTIAVAAEPEIVSVEKIWDTGYHNAFTDLIRFQDRWFCTFRESNRHVFGDDGKIRVITSVDGQKWESTALIEEKGVDLRDPKLSITSDGRLMLETGASVYEGKTLITRQPRVMFSKDGREWTKPEKIMAPGDWLWRVTWHDGHAYGTSYDIADRAKDQLDKPMLALYKSSDGVDWKEHARFDVPGWPNETTVRVLADGRMVALTRQEKDSKHAWIGTSSPPFTKWTWHETEHFIGGPNFVQAPDGSLWAVGRKLDGRIGTTVLWRMTEDSLEPVLTLPSAGDTSYAGLVLHDGLLWVSYYSQHEGKKNPNAYEKSSNIHLAKIKLPQ